MTNGLKIGIVAILALAGMTGCNSTSRKNDDAGSKVSSAEGTTDQTEFKVGDTLEAKGLKIVYVASGEFVGDNDFTQPAEGKKYIRAEFYCENISESDKHFSEFDFECFADGNSCEQVFPGGGELSATLSPGHSTSGSVYFEIPVDAADIQLEYETDIMKDKKIFIYEGEKDSGFVPETASGPAGSAFAVGDVTETESMRISYLSCGEHTSDNEFIKPAEGKHFIYCEFEFENISDSDQLVSVYDFDCFADGASCNASYAEKDELSATLSAGEKTQGKVYFEVPVNAENVEIEYVNDFINSDRVVFTYQN